MKGAAMKLIVRARFILILLLILSLDAVQYDEAAVSAVCTNPKTYAQRYLTFKNWKRSSNDQRKILISQYLPLLETDSLAKITKTNQTWAKEIIADISLEDLLSYINQTCTFSKKTLEESGSGVETIANMICLNTWTGITMFLKHPMSGSGMIGGNARIKMKRKPWYPAIWSL
jgi:hypothetical protein